MTTTFGPKRAHPFLTTDTAVPKPRLFYLHSSWSTWFGATGHISGERRLNARGQ